MNTFGPSQGVEILKTSWARRNDGQWSIQGLRGLKLIPKEGQDHAYFSFQNEMEIVNPNFSGTDAASFFRSFGTTNFLVKQSVVPLVAWIDGETTMRVIGTGFFVSCTGYLMTACHVLLDPEESGYGAVMRDGNNLRFPESLHIGVLVPVNPATGRKMTVFFPIQAAWYWGEWKSSPIPFEPERFAMLTDIAICKVPTWPNGEGHQPLNLSLNSFSAGEKAFVIGYPEMPNVPMAMGTGGTTFGPAVRDDIYVTRGNVMEIFPNNHLSRDVPTPGPCFSFAARVPGEMSGAPIFGADGAVVRGVVSRSFTGEQHAFGAMIGPATHLPLGNGTQFRSIIETGNEGIAKIQGKGL